MEIVDVIDNKPDESQLSPALGPDETYAFSLVGDKAHVFDRRLMDCAEKARRDLIDLAANGTGDQAEFRKLCLLVRELIHDVGT